MSVPSSRSFLELATYLSASAASSTCRAMSAKIASRKLRHASDKARENERILHGKLDIPKFVTDVNEEATVEVKRRERISK